MSEEEQVKVQPNEPVQKARRRFRIGSLLYLTAALGFSFATGREVAAMDSIDFGIKYGTLNFAFWLCAKGLLDEIGKIKISDSAESFSRADLAFAYWLALTWRVGVVTILTLSIPIFVVTAAQSEAINTLGILPKLRPIDRPTHALNSLDLLQCGFIVFLIYQTGLFAFGRDRDRSAIHVLISVVPCLFLMGFWLHYEPLLVPVLVLVSIHGIIAGRRPPDMEAIAPNVSDVFLATGMSDVYYLGILMLLLTLAGWGLYTFSLRESLSIRLKSILCILILACISGVCAIAHQIRYGYLEQFWGIGWESTEWDRTSIDEFPIPVLFVLTIAYAQNWKPSINDAVEITILRRGFLRVAGSLLLGLLGIVSITELFGPPFSFSFWLSEPIQHARDTFFENLDGLKEQSLFFYVPWIVIRFFAYIGAHILAPFNSPSPLVAAITLLILYWMVQLFRRTKRVFALNTGSVSVPGFIYSSIALTLLLFASAESSIWFLTFGFFKWWG